MPVLELGSSLKVIDIQYVTIYVYAQECKASVLVQDYELLNNVNTSWS